MDKSKLHVDGLKASSSTEPDEEELADEVLQDMLAKYQMVLNIDEDFPRLSITISR